MAASDNFFQKAEQALKKRNYDYAIAMYQQGLSIDPDRIEERRKLRAAQTRRVQESGGNTTGGKMFALKNAKSLGTIKKFGLQKKFEEQIVEIEKILTIAPQHGPTLMTLAASFEATDRVASALQTYQEVVEIDPSNWEAWKALGKMYEGQKDLEKAVECWERVKQIRPEDAEAGKAIRDLSAAVMMQRTEARKAASKEDSFRAMLKDEDESEKLQKKAQMIRTADDAQAAIQFKKDEIESDPENSRLHRELGDLYAKVKQFDDAESAFRKAAEVNPDDMYVAEKLGTLTEQRISAQVEDAKIALKNSPEDAAAKAKLDQILAEQNVFRLTDYERRVAAHPTDFGLKASFGRLLYENERWDECIGQYQNARKDPKFATESHWMIGRCFAQKGVQSVAIKELTAAVESITDQDSDRWKNVMYDLAESHVKNDDAAKALELFEELMSIDISFRDVSKRVDEIRSVG